jgi:hypothetical protein
MCGRGARPHSVKLAFTIIDLGGNCITHGLWSSPRNWSNIFHNPKKPGEGVAPVKECPDCGALMHTAVRLCDCGHAFQVIKPKDEAIEKFIQVSKAIDVKKIIESKAHNKEYRSLFVLIEQVFNKAVRIFHNLTHQHYAQIEKEIHELARLWCREKGKRFDQYHRQIIQDKLTELCSSHNTKTSMTIKTLTSNSVPFWKESEQANGRT